MESMAHPDRFFLSTKRAQKQIPYTNNVLKMLNRPFVPPILLKYGPSFDREDWGKMFKSLLEKRRGVYRACYGPSDIGKSVAVTEALRGRKGVVYVDLREVVPEAIPNKFAIALGMFDDEKKGNLFDRLLMIVRVGEWVMLSDNSIGPPIERVVFFLHKRLLMLKWILSSKHSQRQRRNHQRNR